MSDHVLYDNEGAVVGRVLGHRSRAVSREALRELSGVGSADLGYCVSWQPVSERELVQARAAETVRSYLLFSCGNSGDPKLADAVCRDLNSRGHGCRIVEDGAATPIDLTGVDDIICLPPSADAGAGPTELLRPSLEFLLRCVRSKIPSEEPPRFWIVTAGAAQTDARRDGANANEVAEPRVWAQAGLWGFARSFALEERDLVAGVVDLEATPTEASLSLLGDLLEGDSREETVALRSGRAFARRLRRLADTTDLRAARSLSPDASYLITGGSRGVGLRVARELAAQGAGRVVLAARRRPENAVFESIRRAASQELEVEFVGCDVSEAAAVKTLVATAGTSTHPLKGVIHAAGVIDDGVAANLEWNRFRSVLGPKVEGAWNLARETLGLDLDFFVAFSSAAGVFGAPGQTNYAAANAALDAFCEALRASGLRATSVQWGAWENIGMSAELDEAAVERGRRSGVIPLSARAGLEWLSAAMNQRTPATVCVADLRPGLLVANGIPEMLFADLREAADESTGTGPGPVDRGCLARALGSAPETQRVRVAMEHVQSALGELLGFDGADQLDPDTGLFDLGLDSLSALELRKRLEQELDESLDARLAYDYPTIRELAGALVDLIEVDGSTEEAGNDVPDAVEPQLAEAGRWAALLDQIESLTPEEAETLLASVAEPPATAERPS